MIPTVSLRAVVQEMDVFSDEEIAYLNPQSGELATIGREEIAIIESGDDLENYPDWQRALIQKTQAALQSRDYLPLPSRFNIHKYAIMERFCDSVEDDELSQELLHQIRGSGAFRRFKDTLRRLGIIDEWYRFRQAALEGIAEDWLTKNHIPYTRESDATSFEK